MIKAKGKAERAAARQQAAAAVGLVAPPQPPSEVPTPTATPAPTGPGAESGSGEPIVPDNDDAPPQPPAKEPAVDRTELLRSKPEVVGKFMQSMVPILVDVYAASVITPVRVKTLTGLLKAVSFLDAPGLKQVLTVSA